MAKSIIAAVLLFFSICIAVTLGSHSARAGEKNLGQDMARLIAETPSSTITPLNLSKPHHKRVYYNGLRASGVTKANAPQFYRELTRLEKQHKAAAPVPHPLTLTEPGHSDPIHIDVLSGLEVDGATGNLLGSAFSSQKGGTDVSKITLRFFNNQTQKFVGTPKTVSQFAGGTDFGASNALAKATIPPQGITLLATFYVKKGKAHHHTYYAHVTQLPPFTVDTTWSNPVQKNAHSGEQIIYICWVMARGGMDCDYKEPGTGWDGISFEVSGAFTFSGGPQGGKITPPKKLPNGKYANASSSITISRDKEGGGCLMSNSKGFFGDPNTRFDYEKNSVQWDLNPAEFGVPCFEAGGQQVTFNYDLGLTVNGKLQHFIVSNAPDSQGDSLYDLPKTWLKYGCVAPNTRVTMSNGSTKPIKSLETGDLILADPTTRRKAKVMYFTYGTEAYMYEVKTRHHRVLASSGHPFVTPHGVRLARQLKVGDMVKTTKGVMPLTNISIVAYNGQVINVDVVGDKGQALDIADRTFITGGFVSGDARVQNVYEACQDRTPEAILRRLPKNWHQDFRHHRARGGGKITRRGHCI
ncbi:MAG: hypothetical protein QNJ97_15025 [Myxococcota bacterium]|nr:hypothetical protein [Myxococcota bacterium]